MYMLTVHGILHIETYRDEGSGLEILHVLVASVCWDGTDMPVNLNKQNG